MIRPSIILILLASLWSCNYRIFSDGKYIHKENGLSEKGLSRCDSCLVLESFETLPDSLVPVSQTTIFSPYFWMISTPVEYAMIDRARSEAQRTGANVIWVCNKRDLYKGGSTGFFRRAKFETRLYQLQEPYKSAYMHRQDSIEKERAGICIVHVKSYSWDECPIYWNDTLVSNCTGLSSANGQAQKNDFVFSSSGTLSYQNTRPHKGLDSVNLERGKEYYVVIQSVKGGRWMYRVDKHRW